MKVAAALLKEWHRENPARLLQAALWQAERLAQMVPELETLRVPRHGFSWERGMFRDALFRGNWRVDYGVI